MEMERAGVTEREAEVTGPSKVIHDAPGRNGQKPAMFLPGVIGATHQTK